MRSLPSIPTTLKGLLIWGNHWKTVMGALGVNFADFGLAAAPAAFDALLATYTAALNANVMATKTKVTSAALLNAKNALLIFIRPIVQQIAGFPEIDEAMVPTPGKCPRSYKLNLQINPHANSRAVAGVDVLPRTPIPRPPSAPEFDVNPAGNLLVKVRYHYDGAQIRGNSTKNKIKSSARPLFATIVQFYYKLTLPVTGGAADPYAGMVPMASATRSPFVFEFHPSIGGKQVYVAARYVNSRGEMGPWSTINSCTVCLKGANIA